MGTGTVTLLWYFVCGAFFFLTVGIAFLLYGIGARRKRREAAARLHRRIEGAKAPSEFMENDDRQ